MMTSRGFFFCRRAVVANAGKAGIRGDWTPAILISSAVAVAQLVEPLVVVQVVVGSSPISHLRQLPRGRALPGLAHFG
jgi:hypothetical protein